MVPRLVMMLSFAALFAIGGCNTTYVNVPALGGSPASQDPNLPVVRKVEAEALRHVLRRYHPEGEPYAIELPEGTDTATYWWVLRHLPEGGERISELELEEGDEFPPVYRVAQVAIRGLVAQAEVIIPPDRYGEDRLVSVRLSPDTEGWYASTSRLWRIPASQALRIVRAEHTATMDEDVTDGDALRRLEELDAEEQQRLENE